MKLTKQCTQCREELSFDAFYPQAGTKDGYKYECINCSKNRSAAIYAKNPAILEKNKKWQQDNKESHNAAARRYYHSPTGRINRGLNKALDGLLGPKRETLFHLIGTSVSALVVHLLTTMPKGLTLDDYQSEWFIGFVKDPDFDQLKSEQALRAHFNWKNLRVRKKSSITEDFGVNPLDDN